jgi:EmrB/QacA subfamily drug resistance transporter
MEDRERIEVSAQSAIGSVPRVETLPSRRTVTLILAGLLAGLLLGFMDVTIVSTAGPTIVSDLGGLSLYAWVFSAFVIVQTVTIPIFGKLSDLYGRKKLFLLGVVVFMAGSALSGASQNIYELIIFRAVQGIGFGAFVPTTIAIAGNMFPPERRGQVQGLLFSVNGIAFAIAPALGSFLTETISWRWIFYINLPVGIISLILIFSTLRESRATNATPFSDWMGTSTLVGFLALLMMGLFLGGSTFAWISWEELSLFAGSVLLLFAFVFAERRAKEPVLPPRLFRIRNIAASTAVNILRAMAFFGLIAYLPLFTQVVLGANIGGVRTAVYAFTLPLTAGILLSGAAISRVGFKKTAYIGAAITVIGVLFLTMTISSSSSVIQLMIVEVPVGLGNGMMIPATIVAFQNSVQKREIGIASGLATFTLNLGAAIGVALLGAIQVNIFSSQLSGLIAGAPAGSKAIMSDSNLVGQILASPQVLARLIASNESFAALVPKLREAFSQSILPLFWVVLGVSVVTFIMVLSMKEVRRDVKPPRTV